MSMTTQDIDAICDLVFDLCGIYLDESKDYLIKSRLDDLVKNSESSSYTDMVSKARNTQNTELRDDIISAITTNETLFFRDDSPFDLLKNKILPDLFDAKEKSSSPKRLRIWSAACSTGQEAYSVAMTLADLIPDIHCWDISILGTDISDEVVRQASLGRYSGYEIQRGLPGDMLNKYFEPYGDQWQIADKIRALVSFRRLNLLDSFSGLGPFDIIFCRNVAIYFTRDVREDLFLRISDLLPQEGYLIVGSAESLSDLGSRFIPQYYNRSFFYQPNVTSEALLRR